MYFRPITKSSRFSSLMVCFVINGLMFSLIDVPLLMPQVVVSEKQWRSLRMLIRRIAFFLMCFSWQASYAQAPAHTQQGLIFGRVETVEDIIIEGVLRWGDEEAFWDDLYIARKKIDLSVFSYLNGNQIQALHEQETNASLDWSFWSLWQPRYPTGLQQFRCFFGDIAFIEVTGPASARIHFKDGRIQQVQDGPLPAKDLHIYDQDDVEIRLEWGRIKHIEFLPTPSNARNRQVQPLYGAVFTPQGAFEGFIQWDAQERLSTDLLDGKDGEGKVSLAFETIQEIRAEGEGSIVTTFSGEEYFLTNSDDVGPGNHGIIVKNIHLGHVRIPWSQFRFVRFFKNPPDLSPGFNDFEDPGSICASVTTIHGDFVSGKVVFDLDETLDLETIEGQKDGIFYHIPIRNIQAITRKNYHVCGVLLHNGDQLFLGEEHDLTDSNWGLLVHVSEDQVRYIPWNQLVEISF